ncbi:MAG: metallophosphoesterase [Smithellaceae bacterium]|nr:metallophosphoesterase [Smithellaceae bacterium]
MLLISDIHFGANVSKNVGHFLDAARDPLMNPDRLIVIAGDMTQHATPTEYEAAQAFIGELLASGVRIILTPGNHDFGDWMGEYLLTNWKARRRYVDLMEPVLGQEGVLARNGYDSVTKFDDQIFVALRSTHRGQAQMLGLGGMNRIRKAQVDWAATRLAGLDTSGCLLHLVTHRSLWHESGDEHRKMFKGKYIEKTLLKRFEFHSVIHGHNHRFVFAATSTPYLGIPLIRLSLPTISDRNHNNQIGYVRWDAPYRGIPEFVTL